MKTPGATTSYANENKQFINSGSARLAMAQNVRSALLWTPNLMRCARTWGASMDVNAFGYCSRKTSKSQPILYSCRHLLSSSCIFSIFPLQRLTNVFHLLTPCPPPPSSRLFFLCLSFALPHFPCKLSTHPASCFARLAPSLLSSRPGFHILPRRECCRRAPQEGAWNSHRCVGSWRNEKPLGCLRDLTARRT